MEYRIDIKCGKVNISGHIGAYGRVLVIRRNFKILTVVY